ncbi:TlpA family protein disulfide reductase [Aromatoleum petrolei]|uniref:Redoxin domain-containing protein n=1 Tax=Aromatoleum petrolei TaxID=76116 RepID=A0ABX1MKN3_9RHOO|nr:TlpA disulfide reductase family protein [Aromatoleum petrolei]NMF88532.1 redoxin domain-containing protein [Aromatoleum petrolei]QTQ36891.1 Putative thioredoxin [Aromatoleum petrolei]
MFDPHRAGRRRMLASIGGLFAAAIAPPALSLPGNSRTTLPGDRLESLAQLPPAPPALRRALEPLHGKAVLVNFWATWCEPCRTEMPALVSLAESEPGLALVTVAVADRADEVRRFFDEHLVDPVLVSDPEQVVSRAWDVRYLPTTVLLDTTHQPLLRVRGELDWHHDSVRERIRSATKSSRPART